MGEGGGKKMGNIIAPHPTTTPPAMHGPITGVIAGNAKGGRVTTGHLEIGHIGLGHVVTFNP